MGLSQSQEEVQRAMANLNHACDSATGWADEQRERFDQQRIEPILQAGDLLVTALRAADESIARAQGALRGDVL